MCSAVTPQAAKVTATVCGECFVTMRKTLRVYNKMFWDRDHVHVTLTTVFTARTDAEAPILWPPDVKSGRIGKDPDAGKDWGQEKGETEDEMDGWHHWLNGHESEQALKDSEGQGSLVCCSPWGHKELDTAEWLNNCNCYDCSSLLLVIINLLLCLICKLNFITVTYT